MLIKVALGQSLIEERLEVAPALDLGGELQLQKFNAPPSVLEKSVLAQLFFDVVHGSQISPIFCRVATTSASLEERHMIPVES